MNSEKLCVFTIESLKQIFKPECEIGNDFILSKSFDELVDTVFQ